MDLIIKLRKEEEEEAAAAAAALSNKESSCSDTQSSSVEEDQSSSGKENIEHPIIVMEQPSSPPLQMTESKSKRKKNKKKEKKKQKKKVISSFLEYQQKVSSELICSICCDYYTLPYTLHCGHSFCFSCLLFMLKQQNDMDESVIFKCPICRNAFDQEPIQNHQLQQIIEHLLIFFEHNHLQLPSDELKQMPPFEQSDKNYFEQYRQNLAKEREKIKDGFLFLEWIQHPVLEDKDDQVMRCSKCLWELVGDTCMNCGQLHRAQLNFATEQLYETEQETESEEQSDEWEDMNSFIDDQAEEDPYYSDEGTAELTAGEEEPVPIYSDFDEEESPAVEAETEQSISEQEEPITEITIPDEEPLTESVKEVEVVAALPQKRKSKVILSDSE